MIWSVAYGLSSSSQGPALELKRPMISLTGHGEVSGYLYGKLQRATSIYGSGLVGPATAIIHGDQDVREFLPPEISKIYTPQRQLKNLENKLWGQFGMATCEGNVEREDLMTPMSYLKPRLCELKDTILFLDATGYNEDSKKQSESSPGDWRKRRSGAGGGGLGKMLSSFLPQTPQVNFSSRLPKDEPEPQISTKASTGDKDDKDDDSKYWLDIELIQRAIPRGSSIFVVCEREDVQACAKELEDCLAGLETDAIATIVAPDNHVSLTDVRDDKKWSSLRPQDLEGELSQTISVRDGTGHSVLAEIEQEEPDDGENASSEENQPRFKRTREERLAAAYAPTEDDPFAQSSSKKKPSNGSEARMAHASAPPPEETTISRHDLAEVCVQCSLRLPSKIGTDGNFDNAGGGRVRIVRVSPVVETVDEESHFGTERPNADYFSRMGGKKAKAKAGFVNSVDWAKTLSCFAENQSGSSVKVFPTRPDLLP